MVMITFTLLRMVILPSLRFDLVLLGIFVTINVDTQFIMIMLAALLTAAGADWLIQSHPSYLRGTPTIRHWIIPAITSLAAGSILAGVPAGPALWIGLPLASILLMAVLIAEYIVQNPDDPRRSAAVVILTGLAYVLLLGVMYAIQAANLRAVYAVPLSFLASLAIGWRLLKLSHPGVSVFPYSTAIAMIAAEAIWALHYWPMPPLRTGLLFCVVVYLGKSLTEAIIEHRLDRSRWRELGIFTSLTLGLVLLLT